jgi:hypothetical protein
MKVITRGHTEPRRVTVKLVDGSIVTGMINLIQRGETEHRVSDIFVGREEPFVVIFRASMGETTDTLLVINKQHILWVRPEEGLGDLYQRVVSQKSPEPESLAAND